MKYICDVCGTHLAFENQELPDKCPKCSNGEYGETLDKRQLYTIDELLEMGRIEPGQVSFCGICGHKKLVRDMETMQGIDICSHHVNELYNSREPVKMFEEEMNAETEAKIVDRFSNFDQEA